MATTHPVPVDVLRQLLRLDPDTGKLYWLPRGPEWFDNSKGSAARACATWNTRYAGTLALNTWLNGYREGRIFNHHYYAHIVIFALTHGRWPDGQVDHRDLVRDRNLPANLREATDQQNNWNKGSTPGSSSDFVGVSWAKREQKWVAYAHGNDGKFVHLGYFAAELEAAKARDKYVVAHRGEYARTNLREA